mgnify:CR=1 FL=1
MFEKLRKFFEAKKEQHEYNYRRLERGNCVIYYAPQLPVPLGQLFSAFRLLRECGRIFKFEPIFLDSAHRVNPVLSEKGVTNKCYTLIRTII